MQLTHLLALDPSLKAIFESIDNRKDFKTFMQNYAYAHNKPNPRAPKRVGPKEDGFVSASNSNVQ